MKTQREIFSENLRRIMAEKGLNQSKFAKLLGYSPSTLSDWITKKKYPRDYKIDELADKLKINRKELVSDDNLKKWDELTDTYGQLNGANKYKVICYSQGLLNEQEHHISYSTTDANSEFYSADTIKEDTQTDMLEANALVVLADDSMEPHFHQGEPVFYRLQSNMEIDDFAILEIDDNKIICKQVKIDYENRKIILHSLNPKYEDIVMDPKRVRILGKVIE